MAVAITRLLRFITPSPAEFKFLSDIDGEDRTAATHEVIFPDGRIDDVYLLLEGWVASAVISPDGNARINSINLPGDILGMASAVLVTPFDHSYALTPALLRRVPATALRDIFTHQPRLAATIMLVAQEERAAKNEWNGLHAASAERRLAGFLFRLAERLQELHALAGVSNNIPLTQKQIAEVVGVTPVYMNQLVRQFEADGLISYRRGRLRVIASERLQQVAGLDHWRVAAPAWMPAAG